MGPKKRNNTLTIRQEKFCLHYLTSLKLKEAAMEAGYKPSNSVLTRILQSPAVQARLEELKAQRTKALMIDSTWVVERLIENVRRSMQIEPVLDRLGNHTGTYKYDGAVANKSLELLGRYTGGFVEKHEASLTVDTPIRTIEIGGVELGKLIDTREELTEGEVSSSPLSSQALPALPALPVGGGVVGHPPSVQSSEQVPAPSARHRLQSALF